MTTLLGPMLPLLSTRWALDDRHAGFLFTAQFAGSMVGVALSGVLVQRYGYRAALVAGLGAMGAGSLLLTRWFEAGGLAGGLAAIGAYGIGLGLEIPAANLLIAELHPQGSAAAINWLNLSWGVGAAGCPLVVAALIPRQSTDWLLCAMGALLALVSLVFVWASVLSLIALPPAPSPADTGPMARPWRHPFVYVLGSLFFLYVGVENSIGGWIASYAERMRAMPGTLWAMTPALFWVALLTGRALAPAALRRLSEVNLARLGLLVACGGVVALLAHSGELLLAGVALAGLGLAPVFPVTISLLPARFGAMAPRVSGAMFALAGLGGATLPDLVGAISTRFGGLKMGLSVPLLAALTMLGLYFLVDGSGADPAPTRK